MKINLLLSLSVLFLNLASAEAKIVEITKMEQIASAVVPGTLLVFDLDNTVMEPLQTLGSDQWFDSVVKENLQKGLDQATAVNAAIQVWTRVQNQTWVKPVEASTPSLIRSYQNQGFQVIALTARPDSLHQTTLRQLESIGVRFNQIISIGPGKSKGEALRAFLSQSAHFKRVVFTDDKKSHVESVNQALSKGSTSHFEFRYGAADERVKNFNPAVAKCEMNQFNQTGHLVGDRYCGGY